MTAPTPEQIQKVQTNLDRMHLFNQYVFEHGKPCILNAYLLLTEPQTDSGLMYVLDFFEAAFETLGGMLGPLGTISSTFLAGMVNSWASNTPPSLKGQFADIITRFNNTSMEVDTQLAAIHDDLNNPATWNMNFQFNNKTAQVSDLATIDFPPPDTTPFMDMATAAVNLWDRTIWKNILIANFRIPFRGQTRSDYTDPKVPPIPQIQQMINDEKNLYCSYFWHPGDGGDCQLWIIDSYYVEFNTAGFYQLSADACNYLFIDSVPGVIINAKGLYTREDVVQFLGIKIVTDDAKEVKEYLAAREQGKTLLALYQAQGREAIENQVTQKALEDPAFARDLARDPKGTLEKFFDIKIPPRVNMTVVVEDPLNFGLVIRGPKAMA